MTTLITGATGYVGSAVLKLLLEKNERLRIFTRSPKKLEHLAGREGVEILSGDLDDPEDIGAAVKGISKIYHCAAVVTEWVTDPTVFEQINVLAVENLIKAALLENVGRIVYTSSFMALGPSGDNTGNESLVHDPKHFHNIYERTKYNGYQTAKKYAEGGAPLVIVSPGVVFGPGPVTEGNFSVGIMQKIADKSMPALPGGGKTTWSFSFVEDVAQGHLLAMEKGTDGENYILGGENQPLSIFIESACDMTGIQAPKRSVPLFVLWLAAAGMELAAKLSKKPPMITKGQVGVMKHNWAYTSEKAEKELGYAITPFPQALLATVEWMMNNKLLEIT